MSEQFFNSFSSQYKTPFGAVPQGQQVTLNLTVPEQYGYVDPHLVLWRDGQPRQYIRMTFTHQTPQVNHFTIQFEAGEPGLYFYYFDLYTDFRRIHRCPNGSGYLTWVEGPAWQLTVYEKDFATPVCLKGGVFYQIFPDRFCEGVKNKPMPFAGRVYRENKHGEPYFWPNETGGYLNMDYFGGDFEGIRQKLPYLESLGVTYLYLNPIFEAHSNHRYNTADYLRADPLLGTNEEFSALCAEAREHGIRIILDGVFSHTGSDSVYFNREGRYGVGGAYHDPNSRYRPWYDFGSQYPCGYRSWWGFDTLPEVREENPDYQNFICGEGGVIDTWMKLGASGFRLDVADELPDFFIERIRQAVKAHGADKLLLGEVWEDATTKEAYGVRRTYLLGKGLDSVMNYPFKEAVLNFLRGGDGQAAAQAILDICEHYPAPALHSLFNFMSTHDTVRAITALAGEPLDNHDRNWQSGRRMSPETYEHGVKLLAMAYAAIFTLPGVPSIYYGDEVAMQGYKDPFNRGYYEWDSTETRLRPILTQLALLRKSCDAFKEGRFELVEAGPDLLHYRRVGPTQSAEIALNRSNALRVITAFGKAAEVNPMGFTILVEDNATAHLQAGPAGPGGRTTLQYQKG